MTVLTNILNDREPFLLFENTLLPEQEAAWLFINPIDTITAQNPADLKTALQRIDQYRQHGYYLAGYISYEAAYALHPSLATLQQKPTAPQPLLQFLVFNEVTRPTVAEITSALQNLPENPPWISNLQTLEQEQAYHEKLQYIHEYLVAGDTYQVNYTLRMQFELQGSKTALYKVLRERQPVAYSAYLQLPERTLLSLSPELFLRKNKNILTSKPMKGTAPCGKTQKEDQAILKQMQSDPKLHAENLMIVDLMRNDIGYLAKIGSVRVENLFEIERYPTVHQMISTIHGEIDPEISFTEVIEGLFPCGSITGAPKLRTMEIIHELEATPRHVYTGAIGFITPDNDFTFNVPIRTIDFPADSQQGTLGIGGGIILDSKAADEWQESLLKARFLTGINDDLRLIETMRYHHAEHTIPLLAHHLQRLAQSAEQLGFAFAQEQLLSALQDLGKQTSTCQDLKVRLLLAPTGEFSIETSPLTEAFCDFDNKDPNSPVTLPSVCIYPEEITANSIFRRHKTTRRQLYNQAFSQAEQLGHYDALFLNTSQELAEASRHNVIVKINDDYLTPPIDAGALPGVMRQQLLNDGLITEAPISLAMLEQAQALYLCNAVRGVIRCDCVFAH